MVRPLWIQALHSLGLEFWLPLPLLGLALWIGGGLVINQMLNHSYNTTAPIQAETQEVGQPAKIVVSIQVLLNEQQGFSRVRVRTANSALKEMEFQFPFTDLIQIEAAIGQELGLSTGDVRRLIRY